MTLRPEYSLGHSPYNAFLFAAIGNEQVGVPLTVLTALTRLGYDPWHEAARLSDLPREAAARAFAVTIAKLPQGDWKAADAETIAARIVSCLPGRSSQSIPLPETPTFPSSKLQSVVQMLAWCVLAAALLYFTMNYFSSNNLEVGNGTETSTQR